MTKRDFKAVTICAVALGAMAAMTAGMASAQTPDAKPAAPKIMQIGDVLSGELDYLDEGTLSAAMRQRILF